MKLVGAISAAVLSLSLGVGISAYAQQEQHDQQEENKDRPAQEKEKKAQPEKPVKQEERSAQPEKNVKPEARNAQEHTPQAKPEPQAQHARSDGGRIPADRYKANFGREHTFRVSEGDYRNHRFQYGGYWFGFAAPWPSNWLYTQDVFVVEIDGVYYLCNATYPGVNIALNVTL
ncbi:MAG: hypothetical protein WAL56_13340 [Candidatus Sulfotelmatobacter sp.]